MQHLSLKNKSFFCIEMIIPLYIILQHYSSVILNVGDILLYFIILICVLSKKLKQIYIINSILYCLLYWLAHDFIKMFVVSVDFSFINSILQYTVMSFILFLLYEKINLNLLYKYWKFISYFVYLGIVYHFILIYFKGQYVYPITILPDFVGQMDVVKLEGIYRPVSFFTEPAAFVQFSYPLLFLSLKIKDYYWAIISSFVILLSTSTMGIFMVLILWIGYMYYNKTIALKKYIIYSIFGLVLIMGVYTGLFSETIYKLQNTELSNNFRVMRGWLLYIDTEFVYKLTGIPYQLVSHYLQNENVRQELLYGGTFFGFTSGITNAFLLYGFLGGILYSSIFINIILKTSKMLRVFACATFVSIFAEPTYLGSGTLLVYLLIIYGINWNTQEIN